MGKQWKRWETLFPWAPKSLQMVTAAMKRCLLLGRKAMTNLDNLLKRRDITLPTKVHLVKAMIFPVVMYRCESWILKQAEHCRIGAFELWCWRRLLRVPWIARRSNQSIEMNSVLNIHWKYWSKNWFIGKDPDAGKDWGREEKGTTEDEMFGWHQWLDAHEFE